MNQEMLDLFSFLTEKDRNYAIKKFGITPRRFEKMVRTTKAMLRQFKEVRSDLFLTEKIFLNAERNNALDFDHEGPAVLHWIYEITGVDYSYIYANRTVTDILNSLPGMEKLIKKDLDTNKLRLLLKKEQAQTVMSSIVSPDEYIFDKRLLNHFHSSFDGYLWESVGFETFNNWFRVKPQGKPDFKPKMMTWFCYALGKIEGERNTDYCPNFGIWVTQLIGNNNYSAQKRKAQNTKNQSKAWFIDDKLSQFD